MARVLVYGWYGRGNVGDELMGQALRRLFEPRGVELQFIDRLDVDPVTASDGVIFGGGSLLDGRPDVDQRAWQLLCRNERPVFYVGVGMETNIHDMHKALMSVSRVVVTRSQSWPNVGANTYGMPDLVYSLPSSSGMAEGRDLLVIPNVEVLPTHSDPHWKHVAWEHFKNEFAQFLDVAVAEMDLKPTFLLMCKNDRMDDRWAAHEIIGRMQRRSTKYDVVQAPNDSELVCGLIEGFKVVVTQRYHGIVLAQMAGVPHVSIDHHDKLKHAWPRKGVSISYHGLSKQHLIDACKIASESKREQTRISSELYDGLANAIAGIVNQERGVRVSKQVRGGT